jgi:dipeptidyl-peptidase III
MQKFILLSLFLSSILFFACQPQDPNWPGGNYSKNNPETGSTTKIVVDTFADIQILRYEVPGFEQLTLQQKTLIYYLSQATLAGRDIIFDQNCRYNLAVRRTCEAILQNEKIDRSTADFKKFEVYARRVFFSNGIHHHYNEVKISPDFSADWFANSLKSTDMKTLPLAPNETVEAFLSKISPVIFDSKVMAKRVNKDENADIIAASSCNFYENLTAVEVDGFYGRIKGTGEKNAPSYGLNSKLIKDANGISERVYKMNGMYGGAIENVVNWLEKAVLVAENDQQRKALAILVEYYKTGDLKKWDEYCINWVLDTASVVDYTNGFIEVYHDPKGYKGDWQSYICYSDPDATQKMSIISKNAQWFEDNGPIQDQYKKKAVKGISYRVINVAQEGGSCAPATPIGENLPNAEWIRENYGSKSFSFNNIIAAYGKVGGVSALGEFANDADEIARAKKYGEVTDKMHTALHEVLGHASGRLKDGVVEPAVTLKNYYSTLEEGRADLFALYYMPDPKVVALGVLPDAEAYKAEYDNYIRNGMMQQLRRVPLGANIEEDHMRNRQMVAAWAFEKGQKEGVITREKRDGKTYFDIKDYAKLRVLFGQLLSEIQRIKSEGDFAAGKALVEGYGVKVDAELHKEVKNRFAALPNKPFSGFVQPRLVPIMDTAGKIIDVKIEQTNDFLKQQLEFGKMWSFLPTFN